MFNFFKERRIAKYTKEATEYFLRKYYIEPNNVENEKPIEEPIEKPVEKPKDSGIKYSISGTRLSEFENDVLYSRRDTARSDETEKPRDSGVKYSVSGTRLSEVEKDVRYSLKGTESIEDEKPSENIRYSLKESQKEDPYNPAEVSRVLLNYSVASNINEMNETLEQNVNQTFVDRLLYYISEKGLRDSKVYKAAQVDKRLFSKIVSNREYKPSKDTVIALAMALELSIDEANDMLSRAGYTLSHSSKRDIIIEFFFREEVYNLFDANEVLHRLNQKLIGRF